MAVPLDGQVRCHEKQTISNTGIRPFAAHGLTQNITTPPTYSGYVTHYHNKIIKNYKVQEPAISFREQSPYRLWQHET